MKICSLNDAVLVLQDSIALPEDTLDPILAERRKVAIDIMFGSQVWAVLVERRDAETDATERAAIGRAARQIEAEVQVLGARLVELCAREPDQQLA
jgi:hypothetical protein